MVIIIFVIISHLGYFFKKLEGVQIFEKIKLNLPSHHPLRDHLKGCIYAEFDSDIGPNNVRLNFVDEKRHFGVKPTLREYFGLNNYVVLNINRRGIKFRI